MSGLIIVWFVLPQPLLVLPRVEVHHWLGGLIYLLGIAMSDSEGVAVRWGA